MAIGGNFGLTYAMMLFGAILVARGIWWSTAAGFPGCDGACTIFQCVFCRILLLNEVDRVRYLFSENEQESVEKSNEEIRYFYAGQRIQHL